jgi:hypothetical protein
MREGHDEMIVATLLQDSSRLAATRHGISRTSRTSPFVVDELAADSSLPS